jgi:hypothetical protein
MNNIGYWQKKGKTIRKSETFSGEKTMSDDVIYPGIILPDDYDQRMLAEIRERERVPEYGDEDYDDEGRPSIVTTAVHNEDDERYRENARRRRLRMEIAKKEYEDYARAEKRKEKKKRKKGKK